MKAIFGATGLSVSLSEKDIKEDRLECIVDDYKHPKLILRIVDKVTKHGLNEEPGFHIQCWPPNVSSRQSTKIYVYLSKEVWKKLTTEYDHHAGGGFYASRCQYDRFHIHYPYLKNPETKGADKD